MSDRVYDGSGRLLEKKTRLVAELRCGIHAGETYTVEVPQDYWVIEGTDIEVPEPLQKQ